MAALLRLDLWHLPILIRENAVKTFEYFKSQGVAIKVISGDNPRTVSRIAIQAGIESAESFVDAATLDTEDKNSRCSK